MNTGGPMKFVHMGILTVALAASTACEGKVGVDDMPAVSEPRPTKPGPVQDRMPTMDDCASDEIFTNDAPARLLTRYEYDNTVHDLLGIDAAMARDNFPPENSTGGFENSVGSHVVNPLLVRRYLEVAEDLASEAVDRGAVSGSVPDFLYRAFRRPPTSAEVSTFETLHAQAAAEWGDERALEMLVTAVLQSPQFLYRIEFADDRAPNEIVQNGSFEMASRLSYMLWATMPDDELLAAAEADELQTAEQLETHVRRLLADPRAQASVEHFYRQWLHLDKLDDAVKDETAFPAVPEGLGADWKQSMFDYIRWVHFESDGNLEQLMTSNVVFLTPQMADLYGQSGEGRVEMPDGERSGLMTQPGLMALLAYPDQGSPIARGIFVREKLLCQPLPPPPDDMMIEPPDPDPNATTRERFAEHTANEACAGCHTLIDPLGFGFESYDGVGRFRQTENGQDVDVSGNVLGTVDDTLNGEFDGAVELGARLADSTVLSNCVTDQWLTFAMGRTPTQADLCSVQNVRQQFVDADGSFEELLVAIAMSDAMRYRVVQAPEVTPEGEEP